jgi:hypothetical protein
MRERPEPLFDQFAAAVEEQDRCPPIGRPCLDE